jgi:hypothetical protein
MSEEYNNCEIQELEKLKISHLGKYQRIINKVNINITDSMSKR